MKKLVVRAEATPTLYHIPIPLSKHCLSHHSVPLRVIATFLKVPLHSDYTSVAFLIYGHMPPAYLIFQVIHHSKSPTYLLKVV